MLKLIKFYQLFEKITSWFWSLKIRFFCEQEEKLKQNGSRRHLKVRKINLWNGYVTSKLFSKWRNETFCIGKYMVFNFDIISFHFFDTKMYVA